MCGVYQPAVPVVLVFRYHSMVVIKSLAHLRFTDKQNTDKQNRILSVCVKITKSSQLMWAVKDPGEQGIPCS